MTTWTAPAYDHIQSAHDDPIARVTAALEALHQAYGIAVADIDPTPTFDPARGSTPVSFALLDLYDLHPSTSTDLLPLRTLSPTYELEEGQAAAGISELLHRTADLVLTASQDPATTPAQVTLLADIMGALATAHHWTFGRPW